MKNETIKKENKTIEVVEFDSLNDFYHYITNTPLNSVFQWSNLSSVSGSKRFTETESFEEASDMFKSGWSDMATKLVQRLKVIEKEVRPIMKPKNTLSVAGYQPIVPLYLNGCPNNMVAKKAVPVKQRVITLDKCINYNCSITTEQIIEESIKALQIVKKLEAQGYRVNLNLVWGIEDAFRAKDSKYMLVEKIRIKSANEKLNVSKVAFPLVHPSMLRRLNFRLVEVFPTITKSFKFGYGYPMIAGEMRNHIGSDYLLPPFIRKDVNQIRNIDDLENL